MYARCAVHGRSVHECILDGCGDDGARGLGNGPKVVAVGRQASGRAPKAEEDGRASEPRPEGEVVPDVEDMRLVDEGLDRTSAVVAVVRARARVPEPHELVWLVSR